MTRSLPDLPDFPDWWAVFNDPLLNDLDSDRVRAESVASRGGLARHAGPCTACHRCRKPLSPTQQGFGEYERILNSENLAASSPLRAFDEWSTGLNLSWELDVWGRFRRSITSADADLEASVGDYDAILLSLIAEVAIGLHRLSHVSAAFGVRPAQRRNPEGFSEAHSGQVRCGCDGLTSVHLAKSSLESTRAAIPSLEIGLRQASNQLCTLLGIPTQDLTEMLGAGDIPSTPSEVAVGIPADLMRRRPDIRAAERSIAAQSEQIGIATCRSVSALLDQRRDCLRKRGFQPSVLLARAAPGRSVRRSAGTCSTTDGSSTTYSFKRRAFRN